MGRGQRARPHTGMCRTNTLIPAEVGLGEPVRTPKIIPVAASQPWRAVQLAALVSTFGTTPSTGVSGAWPSGPQPSWAQSGGLLFLEHPFIPQLTGSVLTLPVGRDFK